MGKVEVALADGKKETIETKNIIIATGSVVRPIPGFETDGKQVVNSDHILELTNVPKSMIVMGSGAVGVGICERLCPFRLRHDHCRTARPHRADRGCRCFKGTCPLIQKTGHQDARPASSSTSWRRSKKGVKVSGKNAKGEDVTFEAEMLLVAVGRMPYIENLGLESTKVDVNPTRHDQGQRILRDRRAERICDRRRDRHRLACPSCLKGRHHGRRKDRRQKGRADQTKPRPELHLLRPGSRKRRPDRGQSERGRI